MQHRIFIPRSRGTGIMTYWTSRREASAGEAIAAALRDAPSQFTDGDIVVVVSLGSGNLAKPGNGNVRQYRIEKPAAARAVPV